MTTTRFRTQTALLLVALLSTLPAAAAQTCEEKAAAAIDKGLAYLTTQQKETGLWEAPKGAMAISGLALKGYLQSDKHKSNPAVVKGLDAIVAYQIDNGGMFKDPLASYNTAIIISTLAKANDPKYQPAIDKAIKYLRSLQWSDSMDGMPSGQKVDKTDPRIGGWGYGSKGRPDGSNTALSIDALKDAGVSTDDPAFKAAAAFMSNLQNNKATNPQPWASEDGGFIYSLYNGGETFARASTRPDGVKELASYGTMTYAGLKSLIYAGVSKDDPRVVAAFAWITDSWSLDENPNMRTAGGEKATDGLYYYYHVLGRSLHAFRQTNIAAKSGSVDWRIALIDKITSLQHDDGSWVGTKAYMETNPLLVTSFSVLALQEALADLKAHPAK